MMKTSTSVTILKTRAIERVSELQCHLVPANGVSLSAQDYESRWQCKCLEFSYIYIVR